MARNFNTNTENKDEWLTPKYIIDALGDFDVDPCSPIHRPWDTADVHYNVLKNGLEQEWVGRVWLNPPYGKETFIWMEKLADHGNGIALIFSKTETEGFHSQIWNRADGIFFFKGRLRFHHVIGEVGETADAPSCLVAYGDENVEALKNCSLKGKFIDLREV